jgi:D-alanyl-D-alanine carboxypeptidase
VLGCQASAAPLAPTEPPRTATTGLAAPNPVPAAALPPSPIPPTPIPPTPLPPTVLPPTAVPTPQPTLVPTPAQTPTPTGTARPQPSPTPVPSPTLVPSPTADPVRALQQHACDIASPPARLPLPPYASFIFIPRPDVATQPTPATLGPRQEGSDPPPRVSAPHVAVLDEISGNLLYAQDAFTRAPPASITKIVTAIVALERGPDINTVVTTSVSATALVACDGSSVMGLEPNDHVKLETLLFGMMLPSGNDAAEQVAVSLAGSREQYVAWMNQKVAALRLRDTHFVTPSGMDADEHYSSAYDMAVLGRYAMRNPEFRRLAATTRFVGDDYYMHNLNPLLGSYPGADGVKIGYTEIAGRTIVASATRDGHRVFIALLGSRNLTADTIALFDWTWKSFKWL